MTRYWKQWRCCYEHPQRIAYCIVVEPYHNRNSNVTYPGITGTVYGGTQRTIAAMIEFPVFRFVGSWLATELR